MFQWLTAAVAVVSLIEGHNCYRLTPVEQAIISAITSLGDIRTDFSRHFLEAVSLPVLAPILVRNGALLGGKVSQSIVENEIKNANVGTVLHGLSLLPITLPVSAVHLLSAPIAVPYRLVRVLWWTHLKLERQRWSELAFDFELQTYKDNWWDIKSKLNSL